MTWLQQTSNGFELCVNPREEYEIIAFNELINEGKIKKSYSDIDNASAAVKSIDERSAFYRTHILECSDCNSQYVPNVQHCPTCSSPRRIPVYND